MERSLTLYSWKFYKIFYFYFNYAKFCQPQEVERAKTSTQKEKFEKFQEVMDTFVSRMTGKFHGGEGPDAVDFRVYSWINRFIHTFTMKSLLLGRGGKEDKLVVWYERMDRLCKNKTVL